jgi:hypothetical protein
MSMMNLSPQQLREAADLQEKIQALQTELNELLGGDARAAVTSEPAAELETGKKKRKMTAKWRKALSLAAKARWAKANGAQAGEEPEEKPKKRKISAAGRAAMAAAGRARWAKIRGEKKKAKAAAMMDVPF